MKDLPEPVHERLKEAATATGRSLNKMIVHTLERAVMPTVTDRRELLGRIARFRGESPLRIESLEEIEAAVNEERP
ncbi:MAG: hypothetical protein JJU00_01970 [Opitutales bacterium]|nr:hypothetical protein [Opitutales bacterium]